jgi:streptogramin lyase
MHAARTIALLSLALGIASCGRAAVVPGTTADAAAHHVVASAPATGPAGYATVKLLIPNPHASPTSAPDWGYISPGTQSVRIDAASDYHANVTATSPGCKQTDAGVACVFTDVPVEVRAKQSIIAATFDRTLGSGHALRGHMLSFAQGDVIVRRNKAPIAIALNPILGGARATISAETVPADTVTSVPVAVTALDPAGYVIPSGKFYGELSVNYAQRRDIYVNLSQPGVEDARGFNIVAGGEQSGTSASLTHAGESLAIRYVGRGGHVALVTIAAGKHTVKLNLTALPGIGKSLSLPFVGPASSMTLSGNALWFTEPKSAALGTIDVKGSNVRQVPIPGGKTPLVVAATYNLPGSNNPVDVSESGNVVGFVQKSGRILEYTAPTANAGLYGVSPGQADAWFTESTAGKIGLLNWGGYFSEYNAPVGSTPMTIRDGMFTDPGLNAIGYVHSDGGIGEYSLRHPHSGPADITDLPISPTGFWFTEANAARVGSVNPYDGTIREYPTFAPLKNIAAGADLWLYATDTNGDIEMIAPSGKVTLMRQPVPGYSLVAIVAGRDQDLWVLASDATTSVIKEILY